MIRGKLYTCVTFFPIMNTDIEDISSQPLAWIGEGDVVMFLEQSHRAPFVYKVIYDDISGWIFCKPEHFKELPDEKED